MPKKVLRLREVRQRLGVGNTKLYADYINAGLLRLVRLGPRAVGVVEEDLDRLIDELPTHIPSK